MLDDGGAAWRIAVNVQSDTGSEPSCSGWSTPSPTTRSSPRLGAVPTGFTTVTRERRPRARLRARPAVRLDKGRALPASGAAAADDLQDLLSSTSTQCKAVGGEVYAFGAKFDRNLHKPIDAEFGNTDGLHGIHDIHMNQGNLGSHAGDNGALPGRWAHARPTRTGSSGCFLGFQTQRVPTDDTGATHPRRRHRWPT